MHRLKQVTSLLCRGHFRLACHGLLYINLIISHQERLLKMNIPYRTHVCMHGSLCYFNTNAYMRLIGIGSLIK